MESIPEESRILVVDDDEALLFGIRTTLLSAGVQEPALLSDSRRALDVLREHPFHLVMLDLIMPHVGGMELLRAIKEEFPHVECVVVTAVDDVTSAVQAMRYGAYDYLVKPLNRDRLVIAISRAMERYSLRRGLLLQARESCMSELANPRAFARIIGSSPAMARVFLKAEAVAPTDYSVLLLGESGTGKELVARAIHELSPRASGPFIPVNMASFGESMFEAQFFGHTRGAYTGAPGERKGFFEEASGGTLFLDEITETGPGLQAKLLRVLQEGELYRLGSTRPVSVDVRVIAASNRDPEAEIAAGRFRPDLYHRMHQFGIRIPPLRERTADIPALARHFMSVHAKRSGRPVTDISPEAEDLLLRLPYPGNVRELDNLMAQAVLQEQGTVLGLAAFGHVPAPEAAAPPTGSGDGTLRLPLAEVEKRHILRVLDAHGGNRTRAARALGIGLRTLQRKLSAYGEASN